jgi:DNA-binding IclR family transcriptional regulator
MPSRKKATNEHELRKKKTETDRYFVQVVGKALDILDAVSQSLEPVSLVQLTRDLQQSKSSVFRILCTLEQKGLLERRPGDMYAMSRSNSAPFPNQLLERLRRVADSVMPELGREFRESVNLGVLFENHIEVLEVFSSAQKINMGTIVGSIIPPHASSLGKCITAHQAEHRRDHLVRAYGLNAFTPQTITNPGELEREFARVREQGYAIDREESTPQGCCFGAPIRTGEGVVVAAISVSLPRSRVGQEEKIIEAVRQAAETISNDLPPKTSQTAPGMMGSNSEFPSTISSQVTDPDPVDSLSSSAQVR